MKKAFPFLLALLILIGWAAYLPPRAHMEDSPATTASSTASMPVCETTPAHPAVSESEAPTATTDTPEKENTESAESETKPRKETRPPAEYVTDSTQPKVPASTQSSPSQEKSPPRQTEPLKETQPPVTEPPTQPTVPAVTEPKSTIPETEPAPPPETEPKETEVIEPQFDIGYWIGYAKSYAVGVGLRLESSAVDCWDNPIRAGNHCTYLERDIQSRLNRYANDEDITDVWIWVKDRGDGTYDLYIGYA